MKNLFAVLLFVSGIITADCQSDFTPLNQTFKKPHDFESISFKPGDKLQKFYRKKEKFVNLLSVYIHKGFTATELTRLVKELAPLDIEQVTWECDTLYEPAAIFSGIEPEKLTLINPQLISKDVGKFTAPALELDFGAATPDWATIGFHNNLEELIITGSSCGDNKLLISQLQNYGN
ncbi:MAG TPA: hypothetical protein VEC12_10040, partial [Bacteroidia bacterium]|nr:hypothetical protein [Bacteroidia bacterium]